MLVQADILLLGDSNPKTDFLGNLEFHISILREMEFKAVSGFLRPLFY